MISFDALRQLIDDARLSEREWAIENFSQCSPGWLDGSGPALAQAECAGQDPARTGTRPERGSGKCGAMGNKRQS
jgi:hypothetical protein